MIYDINFVGNTGGQYLNALIWAVGIFLVLKLFKIIVLARLEKIAAKTKTDFDDKLIGIISNVSFLFFVVFSIYIGLTKLSFPTTTWTIIKAIFLVVVVYEIIKAAQSLIEYATRKAIKKSISKNKESIDEAEEERATASAVKTIGLFSKIFLWAFGIVLVLSNLGFNVSSLIAGLGIGGIAIALAIQSILSDMFSSFSIIMDKPFEIGDFIIIGADMGTVEKIGIKTTRIKTLQGQELIISNQELTSARINNYGRMEKRRVAFDLGIIYETSEDKLRQVPEIIKSVIENTVKTEFDRSHFKSFGAYSLDFETVYFIMSSDYNEYMNIQQEINLKIFSKFAEAKIEFAYPTQVEYKK